MTEILTWQMIGGVWRPIKKPLLLIRGTYKSDDEDEDEDEDN